MEMKHIIAQFMFGVILAAGFPPIVETAAAANIAGEKAHHPRIAKAIQELEEAIKYMEAAPHDFGGYKAEALEDSKKAVASLRQALQYRAKQDNKKQ
jgi:hypothetical protein